MIHTRQESSAQGIGPSQRPLPDNAQHLTRDTHTCCRRDSNPQSQRASGCRPTPQTARRPGSAGLAMYTWTRECEINVFPRKGRIFFVHLKMIFLAKTITAFSSWSRCRICCRVDVQGCWTVYTLEICDSRMLWMNDGLFIVQTINIQTYISTRN